VATISCWFRPKFPRHKQGHLGRNWTRNNGAVAFDQRITAGPTELGFDSYFGTDVPNYPPYCFIRNDRTVGIPSLPKPKEMYGTDGVMPTRERTASASFGH